MGMRWCTTGRSLTGCLLSGDWKFRYFTSVYDLNEPFFQKKEDIWNRMMIPVPGNWQNYGYDSHQYANVQYPFHWIRRMCR